MGRLSFGTTGLSYQVDPVKMKVGGAPRCQRCQDRVYFNEEKKALGKSWHIRCFTCASCKKSLSSTNCTEHEEEVYCTACHKRQFGPKGYGFAGGAAGLSTDSGSSKSPGSSNRNSVCSSEEDFPVSRSQPITSNQITRQMSPVTINVHSDPSEICPRCNKKVFFAEKVDALKKRWHKLCFKCGQCNKILEPGKCSEHDGELFCTSCYGRRYGPRGYGFGGGVGQLLSSDSPVNSAASSPRRHELSPNTHELFPKIYEHRERATITPGSNEWTEAVYI